MPLDLPTRASPRPPEPDGDSGMTFRCDHYARSSRRQRWLFVSTVTDDAHTALVRLLERAMCLMEQLPTEAGRGLWRQLPTEEEQAVVLKALTEGRKYELVCTVIQPDGAEQSALPTGLQPYVEADTVHVFTIEPQPTGTGRRRKTPEPEAS